MKNRIYATLLLVLTMAVGCEKEDDLTPTTVQNWFAITEKANMDAVDTKIYNIWQKHEIGVFYNDTLGWEDRGRVDTLGNPIYYYEVLDPNYDITTSGTSNKITWTLINPKDAEAKAKMLPLLNYLDATLLAFIKEADVHIPAIMIAKQVKRGSSKRQVYRGFNYLALSLDQYSDNLEMRTTFRSEFIAQTCAKKIEDLADPFRLITESLVESMITSRGAWGKLWEASPFFEEYAGVEEQIEILDTWDIAALRSQLADFEAKIEAGEMTAQDSEYKNCKDSVARYEALLANEATLRARWKEMDPRTYGFLELKHTGAYYYSPSEVEDLDDYMKMLFTYSTEQFEKDYADWPICVSRFKKLKELMTTAGFDVDALRLEM